MSQGSFEDFVKFWRAKTIQKTFQVHGSLLSQLLLMGGRSGQDGWSMISND